MSTDHTHVVNNGKRDRTALFGEWEKRASPEWMTLLGVRYEHVKMDTGNVDGYAIATTAEQTAFNARGHKKTDNNWDLTALARAGNLGPIVGREREIGAIIEILLRKTKRDPMLLGPAGASTAR